MPSLDSFDGSRYFKSLIVKLKIERVLKTLVGDHLSRIVVDDACKTPICECFLDGQTFGG